MESSQKARILSEASALARQVMSGEVSPKIGCENIAGIDGALSVEELHEFVHLAHLGDGSHDSLGFTAESLTDDIIQECRLLLERRA